MIYSFTSRMDAVGFVTGVLPSLKPDCVLTITIEREKSGVYSVATATTKLLEDTRTQTY